MKKKLYKSGNAWALLDINPEVDEVEIDIKDKVLQVRKASKTEENI